MVLRLLSGEQFWYERKSADESEKSEFCGVHDDSNVRHEKRSHGKKACQRAVLIGDGRAAEFLLLEQFSNGLNAYTRGKGSGTSTENDTASISGLQRSSQSGSLRSACSGPEVFADLTTDLPVVLQSWARLSKIVHDSTG